MATDALDEHDRGAVLRAVVDTNGAADADRGVVVADRGHAAGSSGDLLPGAGHAQVSPMTTAGEDEALLQEVRNAPWGAPWDPRSVVHTGSDLRRAVVRGRTVVIKLVDRRGDWLARSTNGVGRAVRIWRSGLLRRLEPVVEHGMIGLIDREGHDAFVMHDLSEWLIEPGAWVDHETVDAVLGGLATFHAHAAGTEPDGLCSTFERANFCNPSFHETDTGPNPIASGARGLREGYQYIMSKLGADAREFVASYYDDVRSLADEVDQRTTRPTLLHGDTKLENLGVREGRLVAIDWGELSGVGPRRDRGGPVRPWYVLVPDGPDAQRGLRALRPAQLGQARRAAARTVDATARSCLRHRMSRHHGSASSRGAAGTSQGAVLRHVGRARSNLRLTPPATGAAKSSAV
jgi:hypothetical protein